MWIRSSSTTEAWTGHNERHGFRLLRAVPRGSPKEIVPAALEKKWFAQVHKTYPLLSQIQQTEWNTLKETANAVPDDQMGVNSVKESPAGFDWAKDLVSVLHQLHLQCF